ncbi:MAG: nucleoside 2-deoxyribosyltransferase [Thermoanaerobaculia bacterium]
MATIYFSGAISAGRDDVPLYRRIIRMLEEDGHRVIAGAVASEVIGHGGEPLSPEEIFDRDLEWIAEAAREKGVLVAEVSKPSTGVGYEIAAARYRFGMPVICMWRPAHTPRCTAMVAGDRDIELVSYSEDGVGGAVRKVCDAIRRLT